MEANPISRRHFAKVLGAGVALTTLRPSASFSPLVQKRPVSLVGKGFGEETLVRLSSNESPYGPSSVALKAMTEALGLAWRYPDEHADVLVASLATLNGVPSEQIILGDGSGEILKVAAAAFSTAGKKLVVANPTFEAISAHARTAQAEVVKVDLTKEYAHDLPGMLSASDDAGLVYICNPNNPTATITPKSAVRAFMAKLPVKTVALVDEAYHHYVDSSDYESVIPLVKQYPNLIVARTFSKVYGMAGLRCGYAIAQPDLIKRMHAHQSWDSVNIMALVAATASLTDVEHVEQGYRRNLEVKKYVYSELNKLGYKFIPSQANFMMIDVRRDVKPLIAALRERKVEVGRVFPALPTFMRVTLGTQRQMEIFFSAFRAAMAVAG